jgi:hypothetical protein
LEPHYTHAGITPPLEPVVVDGESEYAIEDIIKDRTYQKRKEYLVRWKGWPTEGPVKETAALEKYLQRKLTPPERRKRGRPSRNPKRD